MEPHGNGCWSLVIGCRFMFDKALLFDVLWMETCTTFVLFKVYASLNSPCIHSSFNGTDFH